MNASQDPTALLTAVAFAIVGAILARVTIGKARTSSSISRYVWVLISGGLLGSTVWLFQFQSFLAVQDVEFQNFGLPNMYWSMGRTVIMCTLAVLMSVPNRRGLDIAAGIVFSFSLLHNHIENVASVIPNIDNVFGSPIAFPIAVLVAISSGIGAFLLRSNTTLLSPLLSSFLLAVTIIVPHEIGILSISWDESVRSGPQDIFVTPRFLFQTMAVFGGMMIVSVGSVLILDRQHVADRVGELERLAFVDPVTRLDNRARLYKWLTSPTSRPMRSVALMIGVSAYRDVVDVYGHRAGDHLVQEVAASLKSSLLTTAFLGRISDDRFILIAPSNNEAADASIVSTVHSAISKETAWDGRPVCPGMYMGAVHWVPDTDSDNDFMTKAELALARAWRSGSMRPAHYDAALDEPNRHASSLSIDMRQALRKRQFKLAFQRQNLIRTGDVVGYEVLLRWEHPTKGFISPEIFIPLAERDGLIDEIGEWVLMEACREGAGWAVQKKIAVNVAPRQLADARFADKVRRALNVSGLSPSMLEVEITETSVISDLDQALKIAAELAEIGVSISMDDYGTGYSSLSSLQSFPFSKIKIDKAFISRLKTDPQAEAIVRSTVELCRRLDLDVVAEGVETAEQRVMLEEMGCRIAQGFLYGEPIMATAMRSA